MPWGVFGVKALLERRHRMKETDLRDAMRVHGDMVYRLALCRTQSVQDTGGQNPVAYFDAETRETLKMG